MVWNGVSAGCMSLPVVCLSTLKSTALYVGTQRLLTLCVWLSLLGRCGYRYDPVYYPHRSHTTRPHPQSKAVVPVSPIGIQGRTHTVRTCRFASMFEPLASAPDASIKHLCPYRPCHGQPLPSACQASGALSRFLGRCLPRTLQHTAYVGLS